MHPNPDSADSLRGSLVFAFYIYFGIGIIGSMPVSRLEQNNDSPPFLRMLDAVFLVTLPMHVNRIGLSSLISQIINRTE